MLISFDNFESIFQPSLNNWQKDKTFRNELSEGFIAVVFCFKKCLMLSGHRAVPPWL